MAEEKEDFALALQQKTFFFFSLVHHFLDLVFSAGSKWLER